MKTCCTCKLNCELINFYNNNNTKDKLSNQCKSCSKNYRDLNKNKKYPSSTLEYKRLYINNNLDHINKTRRIRYGKNITKYRKESSLSHNKNRSKRLENQRKYYLNNKQYFSKKNKNYRKSNSVYISLQNRKRKDLLKNYPIIKKQDISELLFRHNHKCYYCKIDVKVGFNLNMDHVIPLSRGGTHTIENLVPSCKLCNLRKGTKSIEEFLKDKK